MLHMGLFLSPFFITILHMCLFYVLMVQPDPTHGILVSAWSDCSIMHICTFSFLNFDFFIVDILTESVFFPNMLRLIWDLLSGR